ncbi:hypothetical protein [uncultured Gordonia sp.]|uniref:hypothetical protein n=2 Tax=uncultured Gordonia sp. TaxID=198437 RepID=UPI00258F128D|nr:hypothetical protein [uncultured Gordonia sp.]
MMARPKPAPEPDRYEPCERCGQAYLTAAWWQDTPICCYCYNQAKRLVGQCVECGHSGIVPGRTTAGHYLCRTCSGIRLNVDCVECGAEAELYRHGHCWRCELAHQVDELLTNPHTGTINSQLVGLAEALKQMPRPNSGVTWLRNPTVRTILQEIAAVDAVDQQLLNSLPVNRSAVHIRALLDEHGIAGARVDFRTRFTTWADSKLATLTSPDNQLVMRSYIQWHLSRRFDDNCTNGTFLAAKQGVTVAIDFLNFLDVLQVPIRDIDQSQVDTFIATGSETNRLLNRFLPWAIKTYRLPPLTISPHRRGTTRALTETEQVEQLTKLFANEQLTPRDRLAATLIVVFGQATHKVAALRWDQIDRDGTCTITLGTHPITLESPLDQLVVEVAESTTNRQTAAHSASVWVFPGYQPGNHLGESHLRLRLKALGFPSLATRLGTWQTITQTAPPPVLADALGIHPQTAIQHALRGSSQFGAYVAERGRHNDQ